MVEVEMLDANGNELQSATILFGSIVNGSPEVIESFVLHGSEVHTIMGSILTERRTLGNVWSLVAEVKFNNTVLDELKIKGFY